MMLRMNNKAVYRRLCEQEKTIPIFSRDWWLDSVCGEHNWDVCLVEKSGVVLASMPYYIRNRCGFTLLDLPEFTQTLGPWIRPSEAKYCKVLDRQKDLMNELIEQLPNFDFFTQNWHYSNTNWLPFYWNGFEQKTRYTYVLPDLTDIDFIWKGLQKNIRQGIRKAEKLNLIARDDLTIHDFIKLHQMTFSRQGMKYPYSEDLIVRLHSACQKHECCRILIAEDADGKHHAGEFIVWDENSAYALMGGANPDLRNSGATSFLLWDSIKHASTVTKCFDFEGSMIESVERFFRGFGAIQTPYFSVSKTPSRLIQFRRALLNLAHI
jgi:hypothetical protein